MAKKNAVDRTILTLAVIGSLILLNFLGLRYFARVDLTREQQFTLSSATLETLRDLRDPVTVRAYFTADLPAPFNANARYVRDLLEEYYTNADGNLSFEFIDPAAEETQEDKDKKKDVRQDIFGRAVREQTSIEAELESLGIAPVQVRVNEGDNLEVKRAYMGIAVSYGGEREVIPVVQDTAGLEYDLTTLIRKLARDERPRVAILQGHEVMDPQREMGRAFGLLSQLYDVSPLDLSQTPEVPEDVDVVLVVGPRTPLSADELKALDGFVTRGGSLAAFLDAVKPDLQTMQSEPSDHGMTDFFGAYGVRIEPGLVLDAESATIAVSRQQGFMRIQQPVRYPFLPQPEALDADNPLTRGIAAVVFPFMSPLRIDSPPAGVDAQALVSSSAQSWVHTPPYDLSPFRQWTTDDVGEQGAQVMIATVSGVLPSQYGAAADGADGSESRVVVSGGAAFVGDQFFAEGNQALLLNLMDWLARDDALLSVRTRGLKAVPLRDVDESTRALVKYANIVGVPLLLILYGVVRWRRRESRRANASLA
jgi:gliding-associated putative ABC transporter substrate-binding component GldG